MKSKENYHFHVVLSIFLVKSAVNYHNIKAAAGCGILAALAGSVSGLLQVGQVQMEQLESSAFLWPHISIRDVISAAASVHGRWEQKSQR